MIPTQSPNSPQPAGWQPPANFIEVPSALEGVRVYAPRPEAPKTDTPVSYKCPNCGAATHYDVAAGGVACEYCGYKAPARSQLVGEQAQEFEFTLDTLNQAEQGWGIERRQLHCDSCGAVLSLAADALTSTCPFCGSNQVNVIPAPSDTLRPRFLIPFRVQDEAVTSLARQWLGQGWFHPGELRTSAGPQRFAGIYLPFWTFAANIQAHWRAEVGYEHQERYYDSSSKEWKTRTVIHWRWETGDVQLPIQDLLVSGSSHLSQHILGKIQPFDLRELVTYSPDYLAGWQAHVYDVSLPQAWEQGKASMREAAKDACYKNIPSPHVRNFSMTADFSDEAWRYILLPVYLAAYRFEEKVYQVMANGQNGKIAGQKPVAWWKVWLVIAALLSPGILAGLVGAVLLLAGGIGIIVLVLALVLLVIGGIFSFYIYKQAVDSETG